MATTKRKAFAAELSAALSAKGFSSASSGQYSQSSGQTVIYIAIRDYNPEGVDKEDGLALKKGEKVVLIQKSPDVETKRVKLDDEAELREEIGGSLLDNSAAKHKLSVKPPKNHPARSRDASPSPVGGNAESLGATSRLLVQSLDTEQSGWVPTSVLVKQQVQHYEREEMEVEQEFVMESAGGASEALYCREAIVRELVDTEEEFGRDLQAVVDRYVKPLDSPSVPRTVRDNKDLVFTNLKQITEFHNTVLIEGVKYYADEPRMLGKTFLRLERDFDKHVQYCRDEPIAQEFLQNNAEAREYFEERAQSLGDERSLSEHLKLPIQRIHDYQLLLKDLVKYSRKLGEDVTDLNKALELMLAIPHKASDNKYISNIEGYHGNIHKLGRLLRHDWFKVKFADTAKEKERYLFLFKARILICKVRKIAEDRSVFVLKHIIRLPEVEIKDDTSSELKFELCHKFPDTPDYPILLEAHKSKAKTEWLNEIRQYAADILALAEHAADDLRVQQESSTESKFGSLKGVELEISDDIVAEDIEQFTGNPLIEEQKRVKSQLKHVQVPERPPLEIPKKKAIFRFSDEDELLEDEIQCVAPEVERRIEAGELIVQEEYSRVVTQRSVRVEETGSVESKKVLQEITNTSSTKQSSTETTKAPSPSVETPIEPSLTSVPTAAKDRSPDTSAVERSLAAEKSPVVERSPVVDRSPVVERSPIPEDSTVVAEEQAEEDMDRYSMRSSGSRYRSVSSKVSEEVYVESSRTGGKTSASSSSRSFAMVEETVNGRTVRKEIMTSGTDSLGDNTDSARIKSYGRTDSVGSGCAIEEISSVRHLDGKTYDNNNEEIGIGGRTTRRGDYGEEITSTSSVRKSSKYSSSTGEEDTSSTRTKRYGLDETDSSSVRTKRASALDEEDSSATRTKRLADEDDRLTTRSALGLDEESTSVSRTRTSTSQYAREESTSGKRALDDEETERLTKKTVLDEDQTVRRTKVGISDVEAGEREGPVFTKPLESYAVKVGEDATLECDVAASVLWLKNNKPIPLSYGDRYFPSSSSDQVHHTLHIMGVRESDEDSFTVRASNEDGAVSYCTTRLTVEHDHQEDSPDGSPKFLIGMKNTAVLEKTFLRFMVKVSGSPKPEVKFYKDDRFVTSANQRVKIDKSRSSAGYYELILPQVTEEDAGQYKCIAMNEHGEAESEATLSVTDDKTIFYGLENSDLLKSGETPQFQWLRDGQPFQPEDRFKVDYKDEGDSLQLVFQNVKPEDAGLYTCVGTTSTGRLACSAELTIQGSVNQLAREPMAPKMTAESKTFESSLGSTAMMEFTCEGFPKPYLKLEKDGKEIETGGKCKFMYESDENVILAIKKLEPEDSGKYTVEAMNELGSSTQEFNLSIKAPPKYRNKLGDGEDVNIMVGQELKLSIGIDGIPKPEVKWLKDGKPVKETKDLVLSYDDSGVHTLTIEKATLKDSGSYSVTATNEMSTITDFTRVTVHAPPQFLRTMTKAVDCNIGDTITYQIKVEGDPLPDVKWMKDNEPLQIDEQHLKVTADGQVHSLIINKVKREDSGKYSALITNDHGSSQDDGRMNVRCAPLFTKKLEDFTALEGDQNVEFTVDIECYPKPVVKWFHDKTEITEKLSEFTKVEETDGHTYKLILSQVEREHAGKYICEVSNNLGKLKCDANFVVKAKPRFKKTLPETVEIDEGQSLSLSIEVEAVPEPEVKWYRNGQEITADANIKITRDSKRIEDYHLTVTLVKPEDGGEYEVRASNEVGSAVTKSRVLVHSVTKSKQADETEEGEAETKRLSNRQRKAGIYGFDSDDENEVDRKKSISNEKADDGEVIVTSRGKTTTKRKVTVTHDGVEKILEDSIVESSYGNDAERRQVKGPTVEEVEDETSPRVRKTSKRESYVREDSRQSVAEAEKVDVDFETRITGEVEVEAKVNDIEMKTRITGEVDVDNSNVNSRRTSRQASETEEPTCQQRRISKPGDDVRMVVEEGPVIEKPNATTPSDAKQKKRKWSITTAQVESYIPEESDNLDDEIYQTALGERLRRKFTKKDEDDNLKLTIYEITDGPTGEKSQKVKVSKDENLQHPRIDIYETKKPKISYSSSIDELDESDEEPAVAMDSTKLTRDGSSKDVKKKAYSHSRSVSREEASSRKTSRQSSKVESHKSSSSDDDGESVRTSRKTSRQSSRTEVTKRTESESILDSEGLDKDKIRSRQTSESETKQSRRASRQTSRHDETAKDGDDEAEVVSRKTSRQTSRRETKLSVNEEDVDSLRKTISPEPEDGEVIVTSRGKTTSKRKVTVTHDGVENVLEDSTVESSYGNDDRKRLLRGPTIEEGEDESVRKTSKIGDDEAEFLSRKTSRQSSRTEATREISVNEEDEDKDKKKDKIDAKEEVDDVDKLIEQIRAKRASILADDEEDRLTRRTSRQVSKEKTDEEIEQLLARKTSRQMSRNEEVRKIEESGEDDEVKPVEEMSVLERIRRKYSKATPEDDGDSLDLELEKYRPTSRLDDKYNRLISKQSSLVDDQQSRRASKAGDSGDDERTYSRRTSRLGEDEDDLTKVSSRRSSRLNDDELDRPASRRHSRLQDEEDVTKPSRGRLDDDGDKENDIYSRRGSRETSYSRHTSKDESLEIINPDDESGGKLPPASKYSVTDMKRRSSKLEKIADDEILQVTTSSRISKSHRAEVTTSDGSEVLSSRNSSCVDFADVEEDGALSSKPSRRSSRSSVGDVSETPKVLSRQTSKLENVEEAESARISRVTSRSSTAELGETPKNLCRQESKVEEIETAKVSRRTSTTASGDLNETPKNLSRQTSKNEDVEEAQSARISRRTSRTSTAELNDSKLSRQTSKVEDVEEAQSAKISRLSSRTSTAELNESTPKNLSRQTSKLEEIEAESVKVSRRSSRASAADQGGDTLRNLSRQTSKVEDVEEAQTARISRLTSRTSTAELSEAGGQLSRQTSKVEDIEEAQSAKISRRSSRADGDDTPKNLSRQTSKVERVEESQSSKVFRLNSRQSSTADVSETPKNLSRQTSKLGDADVEGKSSRTSRRSSRITGDETPRNLTRQNSIVETVEEPQKPILSRVNSQVSNAELSETPRNLSRRSSKLDKSESDNQEPKNFSRQESKLSRQSSTATENADKPKNLSRQSSILKTPKDSTEDDGSVPKNFSKSRQSSIIEDKAETKTLSRQSSKVDEKPSSLSRKSSRKSTTDADGESLSRKSSRKTKPANRDSDEISETQSDKSKSAKSLSRQSSKLAESDEKGVPAQIIEEKMDARKVFETLSTVFEVIATGYPHPEAVWYKNGEVLEESERNVITNEGKSYKLEIVRTTHSDAGEYSVVVKNRLGEASSKGSLEIADVKGLRSPRIKTPLESLIIHKYEKAQFTAVVIAFPEPDIKWTIAGKDPQPVVEYIVDTKELDYGLLECTFTLLIPNGHHCHTGDVLFVASNDYGSCETGARLDVLLRPEIQALKDLTCEPYQTTAFEVEIDANPKPRVTWSFKGEKITGTDPRVQVTSEPDQDMYRLTIRNVGLGDEGVYEVEASNNLGVASAIARLKVHRPGDGAEDEDGLDSERVKPGSLGSGDTGKPQQGREADGKGLTDENDLDARRHKPGSLDSEASGKPHKGRKAYGSDSADEDEGLDSRGVKPRTLDSDASGKPQQGRKADGSGLTDENDLDSRRHKPGSLDSDASVKPQRAGKADGKGLADENDLNSRRTKPGSLDSGASGKPERAGKADGRDSADEDEGLDSRGNKPRTVDSDASGKPQRGGKADGKSLADEDDLDSRRGKPRTLDSDDEDRPHHARRADGKGLADENDLDSRGVKPRTLDSDAAGKPQQGRKTDGKGLEDENDLDSRRHKPSTLDSDDDDKPQRGRKAHGGDSANENDLDSRRGKPGSLDSDASDKPQRGGKADGRGIADENDLDSRRLKLGSLDSEASGKPTGKSGVKSDEDDEGTVSFTVARKRGKPETAGSKDGADSGRGDSKVTLARPYGARSESDQADQHDTGKPETAGSIPLDAEAKKPEVDESSAGKTKTIEPEGQMPAFIKRLDEQTVREYAPLEAKVRADGIPKPVLKWLKNGDIINEEDDDRIRIETTKEGVVTSTLYISHFAPEHVAKYTVIAANLVGEVECFARFRMADHPPMFTRPLNRSLEVQEGHPIELRAQLEASPLAQLRWTKNGEKLLPSDRIEMSSTPDGAVKLSIHEAQLSDSGAYKLFAFNDNGEMHSMCAVVVDPEDKIPSIAQPLSEVLGYEGEPLKLTALIEGFPIPTITWMKDSHILHSGSGCSMVTKPSACGNYTEVSLILPNPGPKDAGRYSFVAQNKLGDAESATRVEIARKETIPRFSLQLNPGKVIEGYPAKLAVKAYAYPEPELQWTFNNHPFIPDGIHSRIITDDDGTQTLLIDKTLPDDAGVYAVMATNNRGTASTRGILDVQPSGRVDQEEQAPGFVHNFKDLTVDEDTPIDFSAPFVGNPIPQVEWFKDGIPLIPSKRLQFTCDGLKVGLNIAKAEPVDAGKYTCTLENKHGKASSSGEIQVRKLYQAPHFLQKFTDQQQLPKRDAKFLARVTGVPTPTVQWYRDGVAIESDDKYRIKRDDEMVCLYVRRCSLDDEAEYKVVAKNREGEVSCEARLKVVDQLEKQEKIEPPSFLKRIGDIEVYPGMSAKFTACMTGYPVPSVEWYKNGEPLEASDKVQIDTESSGILRLTIHRTDLEEDAAIYKCRIWNPHGEATCDAKLLFETLEIRPKAPVGELYSDYDRIRSTGIPLPLADKPIISRMTDRRLTLSWKPSIPYGARYPVTYHVEMCDLPDGDWFTVRMGIRSCACDISNLVPFRDYKFRIRVENKYGLSDPSPFAQTMREKLNPERPKFEPYLPPGVPFHPDKSFYFPRDFDLERPPREGYAQAPRFLNQEHDTQYGIKNENSSLFWFVYGYPKPKVSFYFNDELIEMGGRYDSSYTRNGQATLFINKMLDRDVGMYEALASNEHGTARQRVRLEIAEYPHFIVRPEETYVMMRRTCKLEARIWGVPYPEIKWYKDWKPLTESSRHKIQWIEPDHCVLTIGDCIGRDEGLYSVTARNIAGTISHSVTVHVEDNENEYSYRTYARGRQVKTRTKPITDAYDFGDELGRGVTGIVYHAVERSSGRNYAAKVMTGKGNQYKSLFKNELDIMNQLCHRNLVRLHDSYETKDSFTIISELAGGGELLHSLTRQSYYTEYDIAHYIRQLLSGLDYMHRLSIAHLGLTPGDLLVAHPGGRHLLLTDFGLSRRITSFGKLNPLEYGMPEFVAPEIANGKGVGFAADMWSTGVLTYLLLTGVSLFRGNDDAETLTKVKDGHFMFRREHWENISEEARDFISKLIVVDANTRMDVRQALRHPWLNFADRKPTEDTPKLNTDALRNYYNLYKDWYGNAAVRRYYRRRPLNSCYTHPSRMIYPPGTQFTPEPTPDKVLVSRDLRDVKTWEDNVPNRGPAIDYDLNVVKSESHYQNGPDTYLLQLRDVDFPVRLREYIKVASTRPGFNCLDTSENGHLDWKAPVIRERRRFTDVMDEEIDDERRNRINKYGAADTYTLRRLRHEIGTRPEAHVEADALIESRRDGHAPFFREKPITIPVVIGDKLEMKCLAVGEPKPVIQWFKNELVITESSRIKFREDKDGRCIMTIEPVLNADLGIFKIVARNRKGQTVTRCRVVEATTPMAPDSPEAVDISDTEILLRWKQPSYDGHAPVICYSLQFKEADEVDWITLANNIDHEFWHVKDLKRETNYTFRLSAKNVIGWSEKGIPSALFKTKEQGNGQYKVAVTPAMKHLQAITEAGHTPTLAQDPPPLNYSVEDSPIEWSTEPPTDKYQFISEIHRGKFSVVVKAAEKANTENLVAAKLFEYSHDTLHQVNTEFDNLRSLRHERIASLLEAYKPSTTASNIAVLVMEKLQGADVLSYLSSRHEYTEQNVATIISQVLDGLQYLHWRGLCHLNIEPDNVVMASVRSVQVKLIDLGCTQRVTKLGTLIHPINTPNPEFAAPEVLAEEPIFPQTDVWSAGVLAYVLLSGASPFRGQSEPETRQNVNFVRYRFEYLFKELTQEATRFLMLIFKRAPGKRPTVEECHENRWLVPSEYMIKKRERAVFLGNRLKEFSDEYHDLKNKQFTSDSLSSLHKTLTRSNSIQEELISTAFTSHLVNKPSSDSSTL